MFQDEGPVLEPVAIGFTLGGIELRAQLFESAIQGVGGYVFKRRMRLHFVEFIEAIMDAEFGELFGAGVKIWLDEFRSFLAKEAP